MAKKNFNNLKEARIHMNMTQLDVANSVGITESYYNLIENGNRKPAIDIAYMISQVLKITLDEFFMLSNFTKCQDVS